MNKSPIQNSDWVEDNSFGEAKYMLFEYFHFSSNLE